MKMSTCLARMRADAPPERAGLVAQVLHAPVGLGDLAARVAVHEAGDAGEVDDRDDLDVAARAERVVDPRAFVLRVARHEGHRHDVAAQRREIEAPAVRVGGLQGEHRTLRVRGEGRAEEQQDGHRRAHENGISKRRSNCRAGARLLASATMRLWLAVVLVPAVALASEPRPVAFDPTAERALLRRRSGGHRRRRPAPGRLDRRRDGIRGVLEGAPARQGRQAGDVPASVRRAQGRQAQRRGDALRWIGQNLSAPRRLRAGVRRTRTSCRWEGNAGPRSRQTSSIRERARWRGALPARRGRAGGRPHRRGGRGVSLVPRGLSDGLARSRGALPPGRGARRQRAGRRRAHRVAHALPRRPERLLGQAGGGSSRRRRRRSPRAEIARRAMVLFDAMQNGASEAEWKRVLGLPGLDDKLTCVAHVPRRAERLQGAPALARGAAVRRRRRGVHQGQRRGPPGQGAVPGRAQLGAEGARRRRLDAEGGGAVREGVARASAAQLRRRRAHARGRALRRLEGRGEVERAARRPAGGVPRRRPEGRGAVAARVPRLAQGRSRRRGALAAAGAGALAARGRLVGGGAHALLARPRRRQEGRRDGGGRSLRASRRASIRSRTTRCSRSIGCTRSGPIAPTSWSPSSSARRRATTTRGSSRRGRCSASRRSSAASSWRGSGSAPRPSASSALAGIEVPEEARRDHARCGARGAPVAGRGALRSRRRVRALALHPALPHDRVRARVADGREPQALAPQLPARLSRSHREERGAQRAAGGARAGHRARGVGLRSADGVVRQRDRPDAADGAAGGALRARAAARRAGRCAIRRST